MAVIRFTVVCSVLACMTACDKPTAPIDTGSGSPPPEPTVVVGVPTGWGSSSVGVGAVTPNPAYTVGIDKQNKRSGAAAAFMFANSEFPNGSANVAQGLAANAYRGKRVRLSGWVRHIAITSGALWMRVDGPSLMLALDDMRGRLLTGTSDWHQVSVVLDVPANAIGFTFGARLSSPGELFVDDVQLDVVGNDVPTTNILPGPTPAPADSVTLTAIYARQTRPLNLDFEGLTLGSATADWLRATTLPISSVAPGTGFTDLQPLRQIIGSARVVGLGEDTHGTREFFLMKHRLLEFLVSEMGFTLFAIEATWPESNDVNRYVLTGEGDPAKLLSNLYFWTWNTQEVLDLITWMRHWNETAPADRRVQFVGVDMQYPSAAMDTVSSYVYRVDTTSLSYVGDRYKCLASYRNQGSSFPRPATAYSDLPTAQKNACRTGLQEVFTFIQDRRPTYEAASSVPQFANALQSARAVQQYEEMISWPAGSISTDLVRDKAMAENAQWLLDQAGPNAHMALWAHNGHVRNFPTSMGGYLRRAMGSSYLNLGFLFGTGSFNAVSANGSSLTSWTSTLVPPWSLEAAFVATGRPLELFDTRALDTGGGPADPLRGPIPMRTIGKFYNPSTESAYYSLSVLPDDFDLLLFVAKTTPSTLLPFR